MRLSWTVVAAVAIGGFWATPAFAFGHKNGCNGGGTTSSVTMVSVPATVTTTTRSRTSFASVPAFGTSSFNMSSTPAFFNGSSITNFNPSITSFGSSVAFTPNTTVAFVPSGFTISNFGGNSSGGNSSSGAANAASGDLATLNQSIQTLNATMTRTNALLAQLAGEGNGGGGGGGGGGIPNVGDTGAFGGVGISSVGPTGVTTRYLPYHLYAEKQIEAAIEAKDGERVGYYYHKNVGNNERLKKELDETQARIDAKISAAKKTGLKVPGVTVP